MSTVDVMKEMKEAINMDDVWVMALSLAIGSLVLVWLLLYLRFGKSIVQNGGKKGVVKDRRFSPPQARNGTRTSPSTNSAHRAQASECPVPTVTRSNNIALPCVEYFVLLLLNLKHSGSSLRSGLGFQTGGHEKVCTLSPCLLLSVVCHFSAFMRFPY